MPIYSYFAWLLLLLRPVCLSMVHGEYNTHTEIRSQTCYYILQLLNEVVGITERRQRRQQQQLDVDEASIS